MNSTLHLCSQCVTTLLSYMPPEYGNGKDYMEKMKF